MWTSMVPFLVDAVVAGAVLADCQKPLKGPGKPSAIPAAVP